MFNVIKIKIVIYFTPIEILILHTMKKLMLALTALVLAVSCSKDSDSSSKTIIEGTFPKKKTLKDSNGKIISIEKYSIENGKIKKVEEEVYDETGKVNEVNTLILTYDGDLVVKEESTNKDPDETYTSVYTYNSDKKLVKEVQTSSNLIYETTYSYDNGKLIAKKRVAKNTNNTYKERHLDYSYTYSDNTITETEKSYEMVNGVEENIYIKTITYTIENNNLVKKVVQYSTNTTTYDYVYDTNNNLYYQGFIKSISPDYFTNEDFSKNNITKETVNRNGVTSFVAEYIYEYNANGYPIKKTTKEDSKVTDIEEYEY